MQMRRLINHLPSEERPRERLNRKGASALSNEELLAVILGTGTRDKPVLQLSHELLCHFHSPKELFEASLEELKEFPGIGSARAMVLKAAFELAGRGFTHKAEEASPVLHPKQAFQEIVPHIRGEKREMFFLLLFDVKARIFKVEIVSVGILNATLVHPREVFFPAIRHKAQGVMIAHNHPSGDLTPSDEDIILTKRLVEASQCLSIPLYDHLIVNESEFLSLKMSRPELFV